MRRKEPEEKEWESAIQQDGVGDGQPGPRSSAFGAKGQRHPASASTLPLPVVPCRGQVLPWIVLFKKLWKLFHLQSGHVLQPLLYWLRGRVSPFLVSPSSIRPPYHGPLTPRWLQGAFNMCDKE